MKLVPLRNVASIQLGKMLSPKAKTGKEPFPYLRNQNVQWGRFELTDLATMDFSEQDRAKFELKYGDLLVCEGGEPGRCAVWRDNIDGCYYQKALHRVRPNPNLADSDFLAHWIHLQALTGSFEDQNAKTTIAHLPLVRLEQLLVPAIEVDEQHRIAARLKIQLAEMETAREAAEAQAQDIALLRSRLLKEVFATLDGTPRKMLGDCAFTTSGSTPSRGNKRYWEPAEIPWVKTGEVTFAPISQTEEAISKLALSECSLSLLPPKTVLVAMYGQGKTRGQSAILEVAATTNQACFAVLPNDTWEPEFLYYWFVASYRDLRDLSDDRGGNQANLNGALLKALEIPAPDRALQSAIVRRLNAALQQVDALDASSKNTLDELELLPQRLLTQAFEN